MAVSPDDDRKNEPATIVKWYRRSRDSAATNQKKNGESSDSP